MLGYERHHQQLLHYTVIFLISVSGSFYTKLPSFGGATYIRWGQTSCPTGAQTLFRGIATGTTYDLRGGGANYQCMSDDPEYGPRWDSPKFAQGIQAYIGAVKYKYWESDTQKAKTNHNGRVPCAACEAGDNRGSIITIPGKKHCPTDWSKEYSGYLVSEGTLWGDHYRTTFECLDENAQRVAGQTPADEAAMFFHVAVNCHGKGSLAHCPPYQHGREISCVVCTK